MLQKCTQMEPKINERVKQNNPKRIPQAIKNKMFVDRFVVDFGSIGYSRCREG